MLLYNKLEIHLAWFSFMSFTFLQIARRHHLLAKLLLGYESPIILNEPRALTDSLAHTELCG